MVRCEHNDGIVELVGRFEGGEHPQPQQIQLDQPQPLDVAAMNRKNKVGA